MTDCLHCHSLELVVAGLGVLLDLAQDGGRLDVGLLVVVVGLSGQVAHVGAGRGRGGQGDQGGDDLWQGVGTTPISTPSSRGLAKQPAGLAASTRRAMGALSLRPWLFEPSAYQDTLSRTMETSRVVRTQTSAGVGPIAQTVSLASLTPTVSLHALLLR